MTIEIKVPPLPESVSDATLIAWHKTVGESVSRDENLVDLETDKVVLEVPATVNGIIGKIIVKNGATVKAGDVIGTLEDAETSVKAPIKMEAQSIKNKTSSMTAKKSSKSLKQLM